MRRGKLPLACRKGGGKRGKPPEGGGGRKRRDQVKGRERALIALVHKR